MVGYVSDPSIGEHEQICKLKNVDPPLSPICGDLSSFSDTFLDFDSIKEWIDEFPNPEKCEMAFEKLVQVDKKDVSDMEGSILEGDGSANGYSKEGQWHNTTPDDSEGCTQQADLVGDDSIVKLDIDDNLHGGDYADKGSHVHESDCNIKVEDKTFVDSRFEDRYPTNGRTRTSEVSEKLIHACASYRSSESNFCSSSCAASSSSDDNDEEDEDDYSFDKQSESATKGSKKVVETEDEIEEGEIRESNTSGIVELGEIDEDDDVNLTICTGPIRSKNEIKVMPSVPRVTVTLQAHHRLLPVGAVLSIIDGEQVIVEGVENHGPLNDGSVLWITETRAPLGYVDEIFGPVKNPYYVVRYNSKEEVPCGISEGTLVSYAAEFAEHVLNDNSLYMKGYDASGENDEELSDEVEFSDDEKEAEYRRSLKMNRRNACENVRERENDRSKKCHLQGIKGNFSYGKKDPCPSTAMSAGNVITPQSSVVRPLPNLTQGAGLTELPCGIWTSNISFQRPISFQSGLQNGVFLNQMPLPGQMQVGQRQVYGQLGQTMMMQNQMGQTLPAGMPVQQLVPAQQQFGQTLQSVMPQPGQTFQTGMPAQHQMGQTLPAGMPTHFQMGQTFPSGVPTHFQMGQTFPAGMPAYQVQQVLHSGMPAQQLHGQMLPGGMPGQQQFRPTLPACGPAQQQLGQVLPAGMPSQEKPGQTLPVGMPAQQQLRPTFPAGIPVQQESGKTMPAGMQSQQQPGKIIQAGLQTQQQPGQTLPAGMPSQQATQPVGMPSQQQLGQKAPTHQAGQRPQAGMLSQQLTSAAAMPTQQQLGQTLPAGTPSQQQTSTAGMLTQQQPGQTLPQVMPSQQQQTSRTLNPTPQQLGQPLQAGLPTQQQQAVMPCQQQLWQAVPTGMLTPQHLGQAMPHIMPTQQTFPAVIPTQPHLGQTLPAVMPAQPHLGQTLPTGMLTQQQFWQTLPTGMPIQQPWQTLPGGMTHQHTGQVFLPNGVPSHHFGQQNFMPEQAYSCPGKPLGLRGQETQTTPISEEQVAAQNRQSSDRGATDGRGASGGSKPFRRARQRNFHRGRGRHDRG